MASAFDSSFERLARVVRRALTARLALHGASVGVLVGTAAAGVAWATAHLELRIPLSALGLGLGTLGGAMLAARRRLRDDEVALVLDARLTSDELVATAIELRDAHETNGPARDLVLDRAAALLAPIEPARVRPRVLARSHAALPLGLALAAGFAAMTLRPPPAADAPQAAGATELAPHEVAGLELAESLASLPARDDAQQKRLDRLAADARALREKLRTGTSVREAQADLAKLAEGVAAERLNLGEGDPRKGLEAALARLAREPGLEGAKKALADRDLVELDKEMQRIANQAERDARRRAKEAVAEAATAAEQEGASEVAKELAAQAKRLEEAAKRAERLEALGAQVAKGAPKEAREAIERAMGEGASTAEREALAQTVEKALAQMSPRDREALAKNLERAAQSAEKSAANAEDPSRSTPSKEGESEADAQALRELAERASTPEGLAELRRELEQAAQAPPPTDGAQRQAALSRAERGLREARSGLQPGGGDRRSGERRAGSPRPSGSAGEVGAKPGENPTDPGARGDGRGRAQSGEQSGEQSGQPGDAPGSGDAGRGEREGDALGEHGPGSSGGAGEARRDPRGTPTPKLDAKGFRSRAKTDVLPGQTRPGMTLGRTAAVPGETANARGAGAIGEARAGELDGMQGSDVPEEYREQVGRYFRP